MFHIFINELNRLLAFISYHLKPTSNTLYGWNPFSSLFLTLSFSVRTDECSQTFDDIGQLVCPVIHPHNSHWCGMFYLLVQSGSIPLHLSGLRPSSFPFPSPSPPSSSTYDEQHRSACLSVRPSVVLLHSHVNCVWNVYSINFNSHSFANWKET